MDSKTAYLGEFRQYVTTTPSFEIMLSPIKQVALFGNFERNWIDSADKELYQLNNTNALASGVYFYGDSNKSCINIGVFYKWAQDSQTGNYVETLNLRTAIPITPL
jgi:hypothetical protein